MHAQMLSIPSDNYSGSVPDHDLRHPRSFISSSKSGSRYIWYAVGFIYYELTLLRSQGKVSICRYLRLPISIFHKVLCSRLVLLGCYNIEAVPKHQWKTCRFQVFYTSTSLYKSSITKYITCIINYTCLMTFNYYRVLLSDSFTWVTSLWSKL